MQSTRIANAARDPSHRRARPGVRLGAHPPRQQGRLLVPRAQRRLAASRTSRSSPRPRSPNYKDEILKLVAGRQRPRRGHAGGEPRQGAGDRAARRARPRLRRRRRAPTRCRRRATPSSSCARSPTCGRAPTRFGAVFRVRSALALAIHEFFQEQGFYLHPHADHHRQRRRGRGRDVPRHHARPRRTRRAPRAAPSTTRRTSSASRRTSP